jgi:hypothetical protein
MSPEQCADSHEVDGRADIYSLGAVLYRMLVGRPPFGGTTTQVLHAHVYEPLLLPDEVAALLPAGLLEILRRSLAKQPAQRFATAEEMARALGALTAGQTSVAVRPPLEPEEETGATTTMPSLHAVRPPTTSHVLIPAPPVGSGGLVPAPVAASVALSTPAPLNLAGQLICAAACSPVETALVWPCAGSGPSLCDRSGRPADRAHVDAGRARQLPRHSDDLAGYADPCYAYRRCLHGLRNSTRGGNSRRRRSGNAGT